MASQKRKHERRREFAVKILKRQLVRAERRFHRVSGDHDWEGVLKLTDIDDYLPGGWLCEEGATIREYQLAETCGRIYERLEDAKVDLYGPEDNDWCPMDDSRTYMRYEACMSVGDYEGANSCWGY